MKKEAHMNTVEESNDDRLFAMDEDSMEGMYLTFDLASEG
jgi:hypothetical protein